MVKAEKKRTFHRKAKPTPKEESVKETLVQSEPIKETTQEQTTINDQRQVTSDQRPMTSDPRPTTNRRYPVITIERNQHPNRWYAVPLFGGLVKGIMLIPVGIWVMLVGIWLLFVMIYNSFRVWIKGNYSRYAYSLGLGVMTLTAKTTFFWAGITDTYPGFSLQSSDMVQIDYPEMPNRMYATPIVGGFIRILLMIPFGIYQRVIGTAGNFGLLGAWVPVLFKGYYPESVHELYVDGYRLNFALTSYIVGFSDTYPSFWISMKHKWIKVILIILAVLYVFGSNAGSQKPQTTRTMHTPTRNIQIYK